MEGKNSNKGRRLRLATNRFLSMLVREARDISGVSYEVLAEALRLEVNTLTRYAICEPVSKARAPLHMAQRLENRVASFLERPAHPVVIECTHNRILYGPGWPYWVDLRVSDNTEIKWRRDRDLPFAEEHDFELVYGDSWPHYGKLSSSGGFNASAPWCDQPASIQEFAVQWGVLWRRPGKCPLPNGMREWQDREFLIPMGVTAELFVEIMLGDLSSAVSESLCLAAKVASAVDHSQRRMSRATLYAMGKTVSRAAVRSIDPVFLDRFAQFSREAAEMMNRGTWSAGDMPTGNDG
jgi:hypothetical protein